MTEATATDELRAYRHPVVSRRRGAVAAAVLVVVALAFSLPTTVALRYGPRGYESIALSFPGDATTVVATVTHTVATASAWVLIGCLLTMLFLLAPPGRQRDRI